MRHQDPTISHPAFRHRPKTVSQKKTTKPHLSHARDSSKRHQQRISDSLVRLIELGKASRSRIEGNKNSDLCRRMMGINRDRTAGEGEESARGHGGVEASAEFYRVPPEESVGERNGRERRVKDARGSRSSLNPRAWGKSRVK